MKKTILKALLVLFLLCGRALADIEGTIWEYALVKYPGAPKTCYGFYNDNVYLLLDDEVYQYPNRLKCFAYYTDNFAFMYQLSDGQARWMLSYFNKRKAYLVSVLIIPYISEFDLKQIGYFNGE